MRVGNEKVSISFEIQWAALFMPLRYNWVDFDVIRLSFEYDTAGPQFELYIGLLGFSLYFGCALPWSTEQSRDLRARVAEIEQEAGDV